MAEYETGRHSALSDPSRVKWAKQDLVDFIGFFGGLSENGTYLSRAEEERLRESVSIVVGKIVSGELIEAAQLDEALEVAATDNESLLDRFAEFKASHVAEIASRDSKIIDLKARLAEEATARKVYETHYTNLSEAVEKAVTTLSRIRNTDPTSPFNSVLNTLEVFVGEELDFDVDDTKGKISP